MTGSDVIIQETRLVETLYDPKAIVVFDDRTEIDLYKGHFAPIQTPLEDVQVPPPSNEKRLVRISPDDWGLDGTGQRIKAVYVRSDQVRIAEHLEELKREFLEKRCGRIIPGDPAAQDQSGPSTSRDPER